MEKYHLKLSRLLKQKYNQYMFCRFDVKDLSPTGQSESMTPEDMTARGHGGAEGIAAKGYGGLRHNERRA
jgi:hypothetical protein